MGQVEMEVRKMKRKKNPPSFEVAVFHCALLRYECLVVLEIRNGKYRRALSKVEISQW